MSRFFPPPVRTNLPGRFKASPQGSRNLQSGIHFNSGAATETCKGLGGGVRHGPGGCGREGAHASVSHSVLALLLAPLMMGDWGRGGGTEGTESRSHLGLLPAPSHSPAGSPCGWLCAGLCVFTSRNPPRRQLRAGSSGSWSRPPSQHKLSQETVGNSLLLCSAWVSPGQ